MIQANKIQNSVEQSKLFSDVIEAVGGKIKGDAVYGVYLLVCSSELSWLASTSL